MFLTAVAFQYAVAAQLPQKPYLTWTDKYIVLAFLILFLQAVFAVLSTESEMSETNFVLAWTTANRYYSVDLTAYYTHVARCRAARTLELTLLAQY